MSSRKPNPILTGIVDTFLGVNLVRTSSIPHRNRLAVILLDSAFETACRGYLQYVAKVQLGSAHNHRDNLVSTVKSKLAHIDQQVWDDINYYYTEIRCDFYHQSAGKTIIDTAFKDYQENVEFVINEAFTVKLSELVESAQSQLAQLPAPSAESELMRIASLMRKHEGQVDRILLAVATLRPKTVLQVNDFFKSIGLTTRLTADEFRAVLSRNTGSKKLFYFNPKLKSWTPSAIGKMRISQMTEGQ